MRRMTKLSSVILNGRARDEDIVRVYDKDGVFITKGNWYHDNILDWCDFFGEVSRMGDRTVKFQLIGGRA